MSAQSPIDETRRRLLAGLGGMAALAWPQPPRAAPRGIDVLIVGGGFAGSSCALQLKTLAPQLKVTLIEARRSFLTGPMCNALIAGYRPAAAIRQSPAALRQLGVELHRARVSAVDPVRREVRTDDGETLRARHLVIAPGIALMQEQLPGMAEAKTALPVGWTGDDDLLDLRQRLSALPDGAVVVISAPANPYRCPPGPYERAGTMADALRGKRCKIIICDAKDDFTKRSLFQLEWDLRSPGSISWIPRAQGGSVVEVDAATSSVRLANGERIRADLLNLIPPQRAADIAVQADLTDLTQWCPVNSWNFASQRHPGVYVVGDAADAQPMPKSAFCANGQGKLVALDILRNDAGLPAADNKLINTCYSLTSADTAISVSAVYATGTPDNPGIRSLHSATSPLGGSDAQRRLEARQAWSWYQSIIADSFAKRI